MKIIKLDHGKANALDLELVRRLDQELKDAQDEDSVIITASGSIFSAGVDLFRVLKDGPDYVREFLPALDETLIRFYNFPRPVIAAINGHAVAGGCVLACACDLRIMATGDSKIGLTELLVGVPFPTVPLEIVRSTVPRQVLRQVIYQGGTYKPDEALRVGLVDELTSPKELMPRATEMAEKLGSIAPAAFALTKRRIRSDLAEVQRRFAREEAELRRIWADPRTHAHIESYISATFRKA